MARKKIFTYPAGHPLPPGWYVQWAGRSDWQPMDERSALLLRKTIVADGDKVMHIEAPTISLIEPCDQVPG